MSECVRACVQCMCMCMCTCVCTCVCVCLCLREREREREYTPREIQRERERERTGGRALGEVADVLGLQGVGVVLKVVDHVRVPQRVVPHQRRPHLVRVQHQLRAAQCVCGVRVCAV